MNKQNTARLILPLLICCLSGVAFCAESGPDVYGIIKSLPAGGAGRWDYITCDSAAKLLYVPRTTHVMVLSADTGKLVADIPGLAGIHGVALAPALHRGFVSDGEDASVTIFDTNTYKPLGKIKAAADADGIIYDAGSERVLLACGDSSCVISIAADVDPAAGKSAGTLDLGGKPEFLAADGAGHAFITVNDKDEVVEFDPKTMKKLANWPTTPGSKPTSMAIDPAHHLLFVGCRSKMMIIFDTESGKIVGKFPIGKGVDASVFDDGKIFSSCGDGTLSIIAEESPTSFKPLKTATTVPGAKTLAVDPQTHLLYLPASEMKPADPAKPNARPQPVPDSFKIVVVGPVK